MNQWHYSQDGAQYGPVDEAEIIRKIQDGELAPGTPVLKEGAMEWQPARNHACFQVEIYPEKKASTKTATSTTSAPASGRASQSPRQTAAAAPSPSGSFAPKVTNPVLAPVTSGKSSMSGATIACLIIMSIISIGSVYFSVSQGRKINKLELLMRFADDSEKNLLTNENKLKKKLTDAREQYSKAVSAAMDFKAKNIKLLKIANRSDRLLLSLQKKISKLEAAEQKRIEELENWKKKAKKVAPKPFVPDPQLAQEHFVRGKSFYLGTDGVVKNHSEALKWFHKAADMGNAEAQNKLGKMFRDGEGVPKDEREAAKQYGLAAAQGHTEAEYTVGVMHENGEGFAKDDKKAVEWYRKAAEKGYAKGQNNLGQMYHMGRGVWKDNKLAMKWYRKAADQKLAMAQNNLGYMYDLGEGVLEDDKEAMKWYQMAAMQGNAKAQHNLGKLYQDGNGVNINLLIAYAWYSIAATNGDTLGKEKRDALAKRLNPGQINSAQEYSRTLSKRIKTP